MQDGMLAAPYPALSIRGDVSSPTHHLWNNHGTWFVCYTLIDSPFTAKRVRTSLRTHSLKTARIRRDWLLAEFSRVEKAA